MIDYYLSTTDEADMISALLETGAATADSLGELAPSDGFVIDVIGTWYDQVGGTPDEPVMQALPGWFFNVRAAAPVAWSPAVAAITPATPWRVFG